MPSNIREILSAKHAQFELHQAAWKREERRMYGADAVLTATEFPQWKGEDDPHYAARVAQARYLNFPKLHASILAGHLARARPTGGNFSLGTMGDIRERKVIERGSESVAELFNYNIDGIGSNGTELPAWTDGIQQRAISTGHRWAMVEMPALADIRGVTVDANAVATKADVLAGFRPYAVEYSPLRVPMWEVDRGRLDWAVVKVPVSGSRLVAGAWTAAAANLGYYLLVRRNFAGLGDEFAAGGWWLFDAEFKPLTEAANGNAPITGTWDRTRGEIPLFPLIGDSSQGTEERPAMSASLTMELGQLSVGLMNRISEREHNAADAARSTRYVLGTDPRDSETFNLTVSMHEVGALIVPVPAWIDDAGNVHTPAIHDSASGAVEADVYQRIVDSALAEAREIMVRQVSSTPDSSGVSKEAGFAEATSPLLSRLASNRQAFEQTLIYFSELRNPLRRDEENPRGYSTWPRDFRLRDVVADIEAGLDMLKRNGLRSSTAEVEGTLTVLTERGMVAEKDQEAVRAELVASAQSRGAAEEADRNILAGIQLGGGRKPVTEGADADNAAGNAGGSRAGGAGGDAEAGDGGSRLRAGRDDSRPVGGADGDGDDAGDEREAAVGAAAGAPPSGSPPPKPVDLAPVTAQLDALAEQLTALTTSAGQWGSGPLGIISRMRETNAAYRITPETAIELLVASGIERDVAETMVEAEKATLPALEPPRVDGQVLTAVAAPEVVALNEKVERVLTIIAALAEKLQAPPPAQPTTTVIQIPESRPRGFTVRKNGDGSHAVEPITDTPE